MAKCTFQFSAAVLAIFICVGASRVNRAVETDNSIQMNDGCTYNIADYGLGTLESNDTEKHPEVFWIEFQIKNQGPDERVSRYLQDFELLVDSTNHCGARSYYSAKKHIWPPPVLHPPASTARDVRYVPGNCVVASKECRLYLDRHTYFSIPDPGARKQRWTLDGVRSSLENRSVHTVVERTPSTPSTGEKVFHVGDPGIHPPVVLSQTRPKDTDEARRRKISGTILLNIIVRANGLPDSISVLEGLGYGLDEAAVAVVANEWKFLPGRSTGPVDVRAVVEVKVSR
jgi:TonB family protein